MADDIANEDIFLTDDKNLYKIPSMTETTLV